MRPDLIVTPAEVFARRLSTVSLNAGSKTKQMRKKLPFLGLLSLKFCVPGFTSTGRSLGLGPRWGSNGMCCTGWREGVSILLRIFGSTLRIRGIVDIIVFAAVLDIVCYVLEPRVKSQE